MCPPRLLAAVALVAPLAAQSAADRFTVTKAMVPMRDGVRLNTEIYAPKAAAAPLPILFERTPYSIRHGPDGIAAALDGSYRELASAGYVFVFQDVRGKYSSEGTFAMVRPPRSGDQPTDEGTDAHDTIGWLVENVPGNNGRVGMLGISYGGWLVMQALIDPHPALRAASPQASPDCMWTGDDFHHNGAFRLSYGFEYAALVDGGQQNVPFTFDRADTYDWFLRLGGLGEVDARYFQGKRPTWNDYVAHPDYDEFWQARKVAPYFAGKPVTVPTLTVAGFWDQEDWYGPLTLYAAMEQNDRQGINHLVIGPWNHGGWSRGEGRSLGPIQFGEPTAKWFREEVQAKWFAHWLKDEGARDFPEVLTFRAGSNRWQRHDRWPPQQGVEQRRLYLRGGGGLAFAPPAAGEAAYSRWVSDPAHPVPYRQRPIAPLYGGKVRSTWSEWLVDDQRHAECRPDVLTFATDVLTDDLTISGNVLAELFASTSGSDADWVVKLIDVYPEDHPPDQRLAGWQLMVAGEVFRGRYQQGFTAPRALEPGAVTRFPIDLHAVDYTFLRGHRLMVQVQSTWFPLIDRNPQQFVANIYRAAAADYVAQEHRVFHAAGQASSLQVQVAR